MTTESIAVIAILLFACFVTMRTSSVSYILLLLPSFSVPVSYLAGSGILALAGKSPGSVTGLVVATIAGGVIGVISSFVLSHFMASRAGKIGYTIFGGILSIGLAAAYLVNIL